MLSRRRAARRGVKRGGARSANCRVDSTKKLELDALIRLDSLSPEHRDAKLSLALSAVVEEKDGLLSCSGDQASAWQAGFPSRGCIRAGAGRITLLRFAPTACQMKFGIDRLLEDPALRRPLAGRREALLAHPRR